jgi:DNA replication initiation complex subunit (GINS family)
MADSTEFMPDFPIPPANFAFLVESILMQTQIQLGLLRFGEEKEDAEPNLPLARHSIDMLAMLQEKTRGNLTSEEQRLIENGLTELRFRYVQVSDEQKLKNEPKAQAQAAGSEEQPKIIVSDGGKGSKTE